MLEERGDLWTLPADARCVTTNGFVKANGHAVMGRGCALEARDRFAGIDQRLGVLLKATGNHVYRLGTVGSHPGAIGSWEILSFPVKHHWRERADLPLIERSCEELMALADKHEWERILLPRPGCGNGQLSWESEVRPLVADLLDDRVIVIVR